MKCVNNEKRRQLDEQGFCILPGILDQPLLQKMRALSRKYIDGLGEAHRQAQKSTGSMIDSSQIPELVELITYPSALQTLKDMGYEDTRFWSGYLISKPPQSPQLFWHQDCLMWDDPRAYSTNTPMLFLMYYLTDTNRENGCLRVLPGTHRQRHPLHQLNPVAHTEEARRMENPDSPIYATQDGELDVCVNAGDLVVGDARLFHAAHPNHSNHERSLITLWYHPFYTDLADFTKAFLAETAKRHLQHWPPSESKILKPLLADYDGHVAPRMNRVPSENF